MRAKAGKSFIYQDLKKAYPQFARVWGGELKNKIPSFSIFNRIRGANQRAFYFFREQIDAMIGGTELLNTLCKHLRELGLDATLLDLEDPEARLEPQWTLGCVKIKGKNIDLVQAQCILRGEDGPSTNIFMYNYVLWMNTQGLKDDLKADFKPIENRKGTMEEENKAAGYQWVGKGLAETLNKDLALSKMMPHLGLAQLEIRTDKRSGGYYNPWRGMMGFPKVTGDLKAVVITPIFPIINIALANGGIKNVLNVGREDLPSLEAFEAYDKIAQHIRTLRV